MPIGIDDFGKIRNKDFYFVDKTAFIRQLIDSPREVTLITRPRRFGKTLTMRFDNEKMSACHTIVKRWSLQSHLVHERHYH